MVFPMSTVAFAAEIEGVGEEAYPSTNFHGEEDYFRFKDSVDRMSSTGEFEFYCNISFQITNTETTEVTNYHHYLFERASCCYDLWLSDELVSEDVQKEILAAANITVNG